MRTTLATLCALLFLSGCERRDDRETGAELDQPRTDTVASPASARDTGAAAVNWGPPPPGLPEGARAAVMKGDPNTGPFTVRLDMPDGYQVRPHYHPASEELQVLEGNLMLGRGKQWNDDALKSMATGESMSLAAREPHYLRAKGRTVLEVQSAGRFGITYINSADDPRQAPIP